VISIEPDELAMDIPHDPNLVLIDVRRETEYGDGHIDKALNIPLDELTDPATLADFEENYNIYLYCGSGYRSMIAASLFKRQGFHNLRNVEGGFEKIREQKTIPIVKENSVLN
jgi:hydroxyacylglutathione hydrolase